MAWKFLLYLVCSKYNVDISVYVYDNNFLIFTLSIDQPFCNIPVYFWKLIFSVFSHRNELDR